MRGHLVLGVLVLMEGILVGHVTLGGDQYARGVDWLSRYGYLPRMDPRTGKLQTKEGLEGAIREMQRFAGLKETGRLDNATLTLMSTPRCSLPDIVGIADLLRRRKKRYTLSGMRWEKTDITWSIHGYPSPSFSPSLQAEHVELILNYALKVWSDVTPLQFRRISSKGKGQDHEGDIRVSFIHSFHDDGYPFDGKGGTLAHAFFPGASDIAGDAHFDDEETWSYGDHSGSTDLFTVAVHEFGHALGLSHSSSPESIMRPYYQGSVGDIQQYRLPADDRLGIQTLYGSREGRTIVPPSGPSHPVFPNIPRPPPPPPTPTRQLDHGLPNRCDGGFDAVANIRGEVFFFKGPYFWRIQRSGSLVSLSPALIRNFWIGLPPGMEKVDAVFERKSGSHIIFFIDQQYWVFKNTVVLPGYPRPLSEWGMQTEAGCPPVKVGAAFVWAHNGKTYLFGGGEFWRFDEDGREMVMKLEGGYPKEASLWKGVPSDPDDIISWGDGDAYFFKNNSYWVLKRGGLDQEHVAPKSIAIDWMRCPPLPTPTSSITRSHPICCECSCNKSTGVKTATMQWLIPLFVTILFIAAETFHTTYIHLYTGGRTSDYVN